MTANLQQLHDALQRIPDWVRLLAALAAIVAMARGRMKPGCALALGACLLALLYDQRGEPFLNAVTLGATGRETVRLLLSLGALAWLGGVLAEGRAAERLHGAFGGLTSGVGAVLEPLAAGFLPVPPGEDAARPWFSRIPALALPLGGAMVLAADLGGFSLAQTAHILAPLAAALLAVGLICFRSAEEKTPETAVAPKDSGLLPALPGILAAAVALLLVQREIPEVRADSLVGRTSEGLAGLLPPLAAGATLGTLLAARALGMGPGTLLRLLKRALSPDLLALAAGAKILQQTARVSASSIPMRTPAEAAAELLLRLGPGTAVLALVFPAVIAFLARDAFTALACSLPFLLQKEVGPTFALVCAGSWLGAALSPKETRTALALPVALGALAAALLCR